MDLSRIESILVNECKLQCSLPVVVGVSGGADSLSLLHILNRLKFSIIVAHVNHCLRGESDAEEALVQMTAKTLGLPFKSARVDVEAYSQEKQLSIEESARQLRYDFLFRIANETSAQALAVAHHADDQVETVLMHILRGAGPDGLKGMAYRSFLPMFSESIPIVRPLLATWRQEIDEYYLSEGLQPCSDDTNNDIRYFRNRIRHELIPELETYNSQSKQHLWQLSMLMQPENEMLEEMMKNALSLLTSSRGKGFIAFKRSGFAGTPLPVKRRLLRRMIADLRADLRDIGYDAVEKGIGFSEQETGKGECQLLDNVWLTRLSEDELLLFTKEADFCELFPLIDPKKKVTLTVPGITTLNDHWEVAAALEKDGDATGRHICENEENFDLAELGDSLFFRTPMTGERIEPFGKAPISQKLSDLFINLGILRRARERWALLYSDERLIWVVGLRRANYAPVQPQTKKILKLKLQKRN